jgi:hypothetical protein
MRITHNKIPKTSIFSYIYSPGITAFLCSASPIANLAKRQGLSGDYNKSANLRHYLHKRMHYRARKPVDPTAMRKS